MADDHISQDHDIAEDSSRPRSWWLHQSLIILCPFM